MNNDYYVYEHIRLDNNTCFYVGKGRGKRAWTKRRNEHHDRIVETVGMEVKIVAENLSEQEALDLERTVISNYLDEGYGIDIIGMRNLTGNKFLTNHTLGGEGSYGMMHTAEWFKEHLRLSTKTTTIRCGIITSITKEKLYRDYKFSYKKL